MYISEPLQLAWVRVPKTGSTSFYKATGGIAKWSQVGEDHAGLYNNTVPAGYKSIVVIRNPYDWVRSMYWMMRKTPHWEEYVVPEGKGKPVPRNIDDFFRFFNKTQLDWVKDDTGKIDVDEVLCIESAGKFLEAHGMQPLERVNETQEERAIAFEWTEERLDWVQRKHAAELKFYPDNIANKG